MKYQSFSGFKKIIFVCAVCSVSQYLKANSNEIAPPKYQTTDEFEVNLVTGQVSPSLNTVSIGGDKGLSHSISMHANSFEFKGFRGYTDKFTGNARNITLGGAGIKHNGVSYNNGIQIMRVFAPVGTADFIYLNSNGQINPNADFDSNNDGTEDESFSYQALGDTRHSLEISSDNEYLIWTLPNGTVVYFDRDSYYKSTSSGIFSSVTYPNGFKIIKHPTSVNTNTGFQLKYIHESFGSLDATKAQAAYPLYPPTETGWEIYNPKYIKAINNAVEYCSPILETTCALTKSWPTVTFTWPGGMPRAFYIGDSLFSVDVSIDGIQSLTTNYHYTAHDLALLNLDDPNSAADPDIIGYGVGEKFIPRLTGIKPTNSDNIAITYQYKNQYTTLGTNSETIGMANAAFTYPWLTTTQGKILSASGPNGAASYTISIPTGPSALAPIKSTSTIVGGKTLSVTSKVLTPTVLGEIQDSHTGFISFGGGESYVGSVQNLYGNKGPAKDYEYDTRGNLKKIVFEKNQTGSTYVEASYPATCTNRKTCNQPTWTKDAKGKQTDYTYHLASGQIKTITLPANENGIRPQTRYGYTLKYAQYKIDSGTVTQSPHGIYMLTSQSHCANSSYNDGTGACSGNDEVETTFEYSTGNLLLIGKAVTADNQTLRTCYRYDDYGNQIGETQPKANKANCSY